MVDSSRARIASFLYHEVCDNPFESGFQRPAALPYKHPVNAFAEHLQRIAAGLATPCLVSDIDFAAPRPHLLLTFDDGGKSALHISDELCRRNWKGHFFVATSLIGTRTFLDAAGIRRLRSCGHVVGSHSHTHPDIFRDLRPEQMLEEWRVSRDCIAQILGEDCVAASVPGGDISRRVLESAGLSGARYLFTSEPELRARLVSGCWVLGRVSIERSTPLNKVQQLACFRSWQASFVRRRLKVCARGALGPFYRHYVRRVTRGFELCDTE